MSTITLLIIALTCLISWRGLQNRETFERLKFQMQAIRDGRQYDRLLSSGFLHADLPHLFFNMFALYVFAPVVLSFVSSVNFIVVYLASIFGGNLLTLLFHSKQKWYSAVGASGGVSGIVFAAILLYPNLPISLIFLPFFSLPGWVFGLIYLGYSLFGMKTQHDNIGHAAHLGGALTGSLLTLMFVPSALQENPYTAILALPLLGLGYWAWTNRS